MIKIYNLLPVWKGEIQAAWGLSYMTRDWVNLDWFSHLRFQLPTLGQGPRNDKDYNNETLQDNNVPVTMI